MMTRAWLLVLSSLGFFAAGAVGEEVADAAKPKIGFAEGDQMHRYVADFVAGRHASHCGCPVVMTSNARTRGVTIWSRSPDNRAFRLAAELERRMRKDAKEPLFLIVFDEDAVAAAKEKAKEHGLKKTHVGIPRSERFLKGVDVFQDDDLVVFLMDHKQIKSVQRLNPRAATEKEIDGIANRAATFLANSAE